VRLSVQILVLAELAAREKSGVGAFFEALQGGSDETRATLREGDALDASDQVLEVSRVSAAASRVWRAPPRWPLRPSAPTSWAAAWTTSTSWRARPRGSSRR